MAAHHHQPRASGRAQGGRVVRPPHRARHPRRHRRAALPFLRGYRRRGGALARRGGAAHRRRAARRDGRVPGRHRGRARSCGERRRGGGCRGVERLAGRHARRGGRGARRPTRGTALPGPCRRRGCGRRPVVGRLRGHSRAGDGPPGARSRGGRRPSRPADRATRVRQDDDGEEPGGHPAAALRLRSARGHVHPLGGRPASGRGGAHPGAAVPGAAPHHFGRGACRRRHAPEAGRAEPRARRRALPGRDAGVRAPRPRGASSAARGGPGPHRPRGGVGRVPRVRHAGGGDEPLPVRVLRPPAAGLPLRAAAARSLRRPHFGPAAGPHRHPRRGALAAAGRAGRRTPAGIVLAGSGSA